MNGGLLLLAVLVLAVALVVGAVTLALAYKAASKRGAFDRDPTRPKVQASGWEFIGWFVGGAAFLFGVWGLLAVFLA